MRNGEYIECVRQYRLHIANVVMITYAQLIILCNTTLCKQIGTTMAGNTSMLNEHCLCTYGRTQQIVFHMFQEFLGMHKKQCSLLLHAIIQQYCFAKTNRCKIALIWHGIYKIWARVGFIILMSRYLHLGFICQTTNTFILELVFVYSSY